MLNDLPVGLVDRVIKKYSCNRKLYDSTQCKYINTKEIIILLKQKIPFRIIESPSNRDVTNQCLVSALIEQSKRGKVFDINILKEMLLKESV